jgi:hypothetical protein
MIVFDLACPHAHRFEGWFGSAEDFARQREANLVRCPVCDDPAVDRVPSARVNVSKTAVAKPAEAAPGPETRAEADAIAGVPAELIAKLREVVHRTENVGPRFPEEARKIHYEEVPARAIRGQASREEAEALREEGIDFATLPDFLTREGH